MKILYLDCGRGHMNPHRKQNYIGWNAPTQMGAYETGEAWMKLVHCIHVNILILVSYYSFSRCYHWGKLDFSVSFLTTACELLLGSSCTQQGFTAREHGFESHPLTYLPYDAIQPSRVSDLQEHSEGKASASPEATVFAGLVRTCLH